MSESGGILAGVREPFRAAAVAIVPGCAALAAAEWRELEAMVEAALQLRPPGMRRQLRLFVRALDLLPVLRHRRRLRDLDPVARAAFLGRVERSRVPALRRGFWGLRTLVILGYYGRPAAAATIGYHAGPRGWEARP